MSLIRNDPSLYGEGVEEEMQPDTTYPLSLEEWNSMQAPSSAGGVQNPNTVLYEMFKGILLDYRENQQLLHLKLLFLLIIVINN